MLALLLAGSSAVYVSANALATPPSGVTTLVIGTGRFDDIDAKTKTGAWKADIKTKEASDLHVIQNTIIPGGTFGWHSHPGPSLVTVKSGTLSVYHGSDCTTPEDFGPGSPNGSTFVDQGHDLHMVRNNSTTDVADVYVVSFVPAGFARRIDEPSPNPSTCPN